jgi:hypothetical protein
MLVSSIFFGLAEKKVPSGTIAELFQLQKYPSSEDFESMCKIIKRRLAMPPAEVNVHIEDNKERVIGPY